MAEKSQQAMPFTFYHWLLGIGLIPILASGVLSGRLIWEQTVLSWKYGPQAVGFALIHGSGAQLLMIPYFLLCWLFVSVIYFIWLILKRQEIPRVFMFAIGLSIIFLVTLIAPYSLWQRLFINQLISSPHAGDFFTYAAAKDDLATVKSFVEHGIPVGIQDSSGSTGLHAAAVQGRTQIIMYLVARGADVNAIDHSGDSPLEYALSEQHIESAKYLESHGAKRIRGSDEQHKKAIEEIVRGEPEGG